MLFKSLKGFFSFQISNQISYRKTCGTCSGMKLEQLIIYNNRSKNDMRNKTRNSLKIIALKIGTVEV